MRGRGLELERMRGETPNEPGGRVGSEESARFGPLFFRALAQELITSTKAAGRLGIPLTETNRKFEMID